MALDLFAMVRRRIENGEQDWCTFREFDITNETGSEVFELVNLRNFVDFLLFKEERWRLLQGFSGGL
jgi:hypothetical protein